MNKYGLRGFGGDTETAPQEEARLLSSPRGEVYYWVTECETPGAPWLMLTNGLGMDHTVFSGVTAALSDMVNVITWDLPLHGMSEEYGEFSFLNCAHDMREILNALNVGSAFIAGHCIGGCAAQAFGTVFPEYCRGLVLIDTFPFGQELYNYGGFDWLDRLTGVMRAVPSGLFAAALAGMFSATLSGERELKEIMARQNTACVADALAISMTALSGQEKPSYSFPVLDIVGANDRLGPIKRLNELASQAGGYDSVVISRAGHTPFADNFEEFCLVLRDFIGRLR